MIKTRNADQVIGQCQQMYFGATDPHVTGWANWPCKQDLYRVKFAVDEMLAKISKFSGEAEWLLEQEQQRMWKVLKSQGKT
jgi:hypothetical protein